VSAILLAITATMQAVEVTPGGAFPEKIIQLMAFGF